MLVYWVSFLKGDKQPSVKKDEIKETGFYTTEIPKKQTVDIASSTLI